MTDIKEKNMNFEKHLNNLEKELYLLNDKIVQAREDENWGTYKNLILSYKEILNLINNFNVKTNEELENNQFKVPVKFSIKEIRCNSNYKIDNFNCDCPIVIDENVNGFEFIVDIILNGVINNSFKITRETFKNRLITKAKEMPYKAYKWGGNTPELGFDCSGLVQYVYKNSTGLKIGRTVYDQLKKGNIIAKNKLQAGDVVFFGRKDIPYHVGIYLGNDEYIHSPKSGDVVKISKLSNRNDYITARRYF
ncbi:peptidoglycan endopeptidase [Clostridium botulinum]|nr:hypothetical protein [Clostridium botulinum]MBN3367189.1 hypothetical protein [Clostridium botulinum]MBN3371822.1 hypothetical protein [Clostridium botulinum]MBN3375706.1 hypothetical protein [Clostridium botulinum]MBN3384278.1 hypothetical protein [Clostridium botulinum]